MYLGLEPGAAGWKAQKNPLSYGGTPNPFKCLQGLSSPYRAVLDQVQVKGYELDS